MLFISCWPHCIKCNHECTHRSGLWYCPAPCPCSGLAWWRHQMKTFPALLTLCAGNSLVTGDIALMFLWSAPWINGWVNNREAGYLIRHRAHYDVVVMGVSQNDDPSRLWWEFGSNTTIITWKNNCTWCSFSEIGVGSTSDIFHFSLPGFSPFIQFSNLISHSLSHRRKPHPHPISVHTYIYMCSLPHCVSTWQ